MKKKKNKGFWKTLAIVLVCMMSIFTLSACMGMGGGSYGSGSSSGGSSGGSSGETPGGSSGGSEPSKPDYPKDDQESTYIDDYNDVFLGGIGVYDVDHTAKVFYNKYSNEFVDFDTLLNRQFETLAKVLYEHINYVYGTKSFNGSLSAFNATFDNNLNSTIYDTTDTIKYPGTINSEYTLKKFVTTDVDTGETTTTFQYSDSSSSSGEGEPNPTWNLQLANPNDMVGALRYIYKNTISTTNSGFLHLGDGTLSSAYNGFSNSTDDNSDIKTIGFTKDYMWNVLYYIAYGVVGETNITNSNIASSVVAQAATVDADNYTSFNKYKGYEHILPEIVEKAFKMVESGGTITKSDDYYCFDVDNYSKFAEDTIFPILNRKEYIFFDDINDICDAEKDEFLLDDFEMESVDSSKEVDYEDYENKTIKVGSLRKLEKIIMLPEINSRLDLSEFSFNDVFLCLTTKEGDPEVEVKLSKKVIDKIGTVVADQVKFTGNGYSMDMGDGKKIEVEAGEEITKDGHLIINDFPSVNKNSQFVSLFEDAKTAEAFKYTSIADTSLVTNAFKEDKYTVATTDDEINMARLNVNNKLFKIKVDENGDYEWTVDIDKNLIELSFEYYAKGGDKLAETPEVYLLAFDIL